MNFEKLEKSLNVNEWKKNTYEKLKQKLTPLILSILILSILILSNPTFKDLNKLYSKTIDVVKNLFIQTAYAEEISREQLENVKNYENIYIDSVSWYINVNEPIWWFADWKYKLEERIIKELSINHINITTDRWEKLTIWLHNPFVLFLNFEKKKGIARFKKSFWLLFDKKWNYLYLLWIVIKDKFYPFKKAERFKITKIKEIIEKENNKIIIKKWGEQIIKIKIPSIKRMGIKWWKIILKISTD